MSNDNYHHYSAPPGRVGNPRRKKRKARRRPKDMRYKSKPSGARRYNDYLERDKYKEYVQKKLDEKDDFSTVESYDSAESKKGTLISGGFGEAVKDENNPYLIAEKEERKKARQEELLRKCVITILGLILAIGLNIFSFHVPFTPRIINIDFSAFPEMLVALSVNPLIGFAVIVVKNAIYLLIRPGAISSIPNKIILDCVFVIISWALFRLSIKSKRIENKNELRQSRGLSEKDYSTALIILSGAVGSIVTAALSVFTVKYLLLPHLYSHFAAAGFNQITVLADYKRAYFGVCRLLPFVGSITPSVDSINKGLLFFNVPLALAKYFVCTLLTSLVYSPIEEYLKRK